MNDNRKKKSQLIQELDVLRREVEELKATDALRLQVEKKLKDSEAFTRSVIENSPLGISARNQTGRLLFHNLAWKLIWAIPDEAIQEDMSRERAELAFDDRDNYLKPYQNKLKQMYQKGGFLKIPEIPTSSKRPGAAKWVSQYFYAIPNDRGIVERVVILTEDVSEQVKIQNEIRRRNQELASLNAIATLVSESLDLDSIIDAVLEQIVTSIRVDGAECHLIDDVGNLALALTWGLEESFALASRYVRFPSTEGIPGNAFARRSPVYVPDIAIDERYIRRDLARTARYKSLLCVPILDRDSHIGTIMLYTRKNRRFSSSVQSLLMTISGQLATAIERVKYFNDLQSSEERFRLLVDKAPIGILSADMEGKILSVNPALTTILGFPSAEATQSINMLTFPPMVKAGLTEDVHKCLQTEKPLSAEREYQNKWGRIIILKYHLTPMRDTNGQIIGLQALIEDITEQKRTEEQVKASLAEKEMLLQEIHHRVKNNMQVISSLLDLQSDQTQDIRAQRFLREGQSRVKSMALVHEMLYRDPDLSRVDFAEYIRNLTKILFSLHFVDPEIIHLNTKLEKVYLGIDLAIPCGLIVNELVSNSLKHAFPGRMFGEVEVVLHKEDSGCFLIVSDNGIGIPEEINWKETETLGLQLVRILVKQIKGNIEFDGRNGTAFMVTFVDGKREMEKPL